MAKWTVEIRSLDGRVQAREPFHFRRKALRYAEVMASPVYDVWMVRSNGTGEILSKHVPPSKFMRRQAPGDWP